MLCVQLSSWKWWGHAWAFEGQCWRQLDWALQRWVLKLPLADSSLWHPPPHRPSSACQAALLLLPPTHSGTFPRTALGGGGGGNCQFGNTTLTISALAPFPCSLSVFAFLMKGSWYYRNQHGWFYLLPKRAYLTRDRWCLHSLEAKTILIQNPASMRPPGFGRNAEWQK